MWHVAWFSLGKLEWLKLTREWSTVMIFWFHPIRQAEADQIFLPANQAQRDATTVGHSLVAFSVSRANTKPGALFTWRTLLRFLPFLLESDIHVGSDLWASLIDVLFSVNSIQLSDFIPEPKLLIAGEPSAERRQSLDRLLKAKVTLIPEVRMRALLYAWKYKRVELRRSRGGRKIRLHKLGGERRTCSWRWDL